ncbi:hypothetical protein CEXT_208631 [Caerostris extrusa]|uniref:Methyltransferase n=1 Tax=Caerostris extrusa TaxID=172846 RepID=A0AAV4P8U7_CAEEX|nr:hypothetical protein CEXT_208631 [Caerostris extrusa]
MRTPLEWCWDATQPEDVDGFESCGTGQTKCMHPGQSLASTGPYWHDHPLWGIVMNIDIYNKKAAQNECYLTADMGCATGRILTMMK